MWKYSFLYLLNVFSLHHVNSRGELQANILKKSIILVEKSICLFEALK